MRGKWLLFSGVVVLAAIAAGALSVLRKPAPPPVKKESPAPAPVELEEISLMGKIQAAHVVSIPSPTDGIVERWDVDIGQEVLEGQPLGHVSNNGLELAKEQAQMELERAQTRVTNLEGQILAAKLDAARTESDAARTKAERGRLERIYQRQEMLYKEGATPRLVFEKSGADWRTAQDEAATAETLALAAADRVEKLGKDLQLAKSTVDDRMGVLESAKEAAEATNILAPADGSILKLGAEAGGEVDRSMRDLIQIAVDPALLELVVEPEAKFIGRIKPGAPALVIVPDVTSEGLSGQVKEIRGTQVIIEFTSPNPVIRHGMAGSARIKLT